MEELTMRKMERSIAPAWIALAILVTCAAAKGDEFFNLVAAGSGGTVVTDSGRNIIHLTDNLISQNSSFIVLAGQNVSDTMSWGGVPNAIQFTENSTGTQASITFPSTGFTRTFIGANPIDLQNQIHDFIKKDGSKAYAEFLSQMNQLSTVATLDGNPQASTALIADDVFSRFGVRNVQPTETRQYSGGAYLAFSGDGGFTRGNDLNGTWGDFSFDAGIRFGSNVALSFGTLGVYRQTAGSRAYTIAEEISLPVTIINNTHNGFSWQVTPWGFGGLSASYDQAAGGILVGGGGTSSLALHLGTFTLTMGNQISYDGNVNISIDGYNFDTVINQWILKNGLDAQFQFPGTPVFIDGGATYSNFLHHGAVPDYWTPFAGVGFAFNPHSYVRAGFKGDYAKNYNNTGGEVALVISY
jgi:hypothetical protein